MVLCHVTHVTKVHLYPPHAPARWEWKIG
uniref:Uncharacterized protein n=1 Tax=Anguilla anguilla TaxID=7936 RepID=A0A0E9PUI2_ANGAN